MAQNFIGCDREQSFLPPGVRDWLPEGHFAWFVLDAVAGMDLAAFYDAYRREGMGRRADDLELCAKAGLAQVGVVAIDGTKVAANANRHAVMDYEQIAREVIEEAKQIDAAEDVLYGEARRDELPPELATGEGRRKWLAESKRQLDEQRAKDSRPIPGPRPKRLKEAAPAGGRAAGRAAREHGL